jgi:long-subunit fatty acid transport protein
MKKIFLSLSLFLLAGQLFAQNPAETYYGFRLGLTAHPTIGWIKPESDNGKGDGVNLGFSYGLLADFNIAENYSFSTGLTVTTINGKSTEFNVNPYHEAAGNSTALTAYNLKYMLQYIEIPLTLKLKTEKVGDVRWYGQFGLSNDFSIGAKQNVSSMGQNSQEDLNIKDDINFYRAGLIIGAGVEYDVARNTSITTGLTYNNGFTDISDDKNRSVRNHYLALNFGVFF